MVVNKKLKQIIIGMIISLVFVLPFNLQAKNINIGQVGDTVSVLGSLCLAGSCAQNWEEISGAWQDAGSSIYFIGGNVGIGLTNPATMLDVAGSFRASGQLMFSNALYTGSGTRILTVDNSGNVLATSSASFLMPAPSVAGQILRANDSLNWEASSNLFIKADGNIGIGTTNAAAPLTVKNNSWISALDGAGTGVVNMFRVNANNQIEVGGPLMIGSFEFAPDSGLVTLADMPVTSASTIGTPQGYALKVDGQNILGIYTESNGAGGIQNDRIGIGTMAPSRRLSIVDSGLGFDRIATNVLGIYTSNLERMRIEAAGNIGIGTTAPSQKLHVAGALQLDAVSFGVTPGTSQNLALSTVEYVNNIVSGVSTSTVGFWSLNGGTIYNVNSGNVGIGTSTAPYKLNVQGDINLTGSLLQNGAPFTGSKWTSNGTSIFYNDGNVGIGTTNPAQKLDVIGRGVFGTFAASRGAYANTLSLQNNTGSDTSLFLWQSGVASGHIGFAASSSVLRIANSTSDGSLVNTSSINLTQSGNVGIGTTTPTQKLHVAGGLQLDAISYGVTPGSAQTLALSTVEYVNSKVGGAGGVGVGISGQTLRHDGTSWVANSTLFNDGANVGIGTTTPNQKLSVNGAIQTFGGIAAQDGSYGVFDYLSGSSRIVSNGLDSSTRGTISFITRTSNRANTITPMFIDSAGNVGIGTTNPGSTLDVQNGLFTQVIIKGTETTRAGELLVLNSSNIGVNVNVTGPTYASGDVNSALISPYGTNLIGFGASRGRPKLSVNVSSGNVGIATTTPTQKLHVAGGLQLDAISYGVTPGSSQSLALSTVEYVNNIVSGASTSTVGFWTQNGTSIYNNNAGNVGIGVTNPTTARLQISQATDTEGLRIIASNFSPLVVRDTADTSDLLRLNQVGKLEIASAIKIANTTETCDTTQSGTFKYDSVSGQSYLCDGKRWINQKNCGLMTDADGNTYGTVQIGGQCWMAENINVGVMLASAATMPNTTDQVIEKWCYDNSAANCAAEGGLYHWDEAMRGSQVAGAQGICPAGWHVPTDAEYNILEKTVLGVIASTNPQYVCDLSYSGWRRCADNTGTDQGANGVGQALTRVGLGSGVGAGKDLVGFSANFPGGRNTGGSFSARGSVLALWSSSPSGSNAWSRGLHSAYSTVYRDADSKASGFSVRCLRD